MQLRNMKSNLVVLSGKQNKGNLLASSPPTHTKKKKREVVDQTLIILWRVSILKLIIYHSYIYLGGAEKILRSLTEYLVHRGYDVTIMATPNSRAEFKTAFDPSVRCIRSRFVRKDYGHNFITKFTNSVLQKIYRLNAILFLKMHRFDVGIAFMEGAITKEAVSIKADRKYAWVHCDWRYYYHNEPFYQKYYSGISEEYGVMKKYDKIVCVSKAAREGVIETIGDTGNLCVLYNPIDWREIRTKAKEPCQVRKDRSRPLIVTIGSLGKVKNFIILLEACCKLKGIVSFDLWMIGNGSEEQNLKKYADENKLDNVHFLGYQQNPYNYLGQADLFVSTSISESYGLAVQEAFILGVPVIAVRCSGIEEAFDQRFGKLINNSAEELADGIKEVFENNDILQGYRLSIKENFSVNELFESRMEKICQLWENDK